MLRKARLLYFRVPYTGTYSYRWNCSIRHGTIYCINFWGHLFTYHLMLRSAPVRPLQRFVTHEINTLYCKCASFIMTAILSYTHTVTKSAIKIAAVCFGVWRSVNCTTLRLRKAYHQAKAVKTECSANKALQSIIRQACRIDINCCSDEASIYRGFHCHRDRVLLCLMGVTRYTNDYRLQTKCESLSIHRAKADYVPKTFQQFE